jgi:hypothetical protein
MIILMPRLGDPHILKYKMANGNWLARCDKILAKNISIITLAADNTYPELCRTCREAENELLLSELNYNPRSAFNVFQSHLYSLRRYLQNEEAGPRNTYFYLTSKRWPKLRKIKDFIKKR